MFQKFLRNNIFTLVIDKKLVYLFLKVVDFQNFSHCLIQSRGINSTLYNDKKLSKLGFF